MPQVNLNCNSIKYAFISFYLTKKSKFSIAVDHLSKYLAMRLTLDLDTDLPDSDKLLNFCIYVAPQPGQLVALSGNQTLRQINDKFWKVRIVLYYIFCA